MAKEPLKIVCSRCYEKREEVEAYWVRYKGMETNIGWYFLCKNCVEKKDEFAGKQYDLIPVKKSPKHE